MRHRPFLPSRFAPVLFAPALMAAATALACLPALAQPANTTAAAASRAWALPAGPLGATLLQIAQQSGQPISVPPELVRGLSAPAVQGSHTVEQAVRTAIAGQPLDLVRTANGTLTLRARPGGAPAPAVNTEPSGAALAAVTVTAQAERESATGPVLGYVARRSATGTKTDTSILETPQTINVITREQIEMQGAQTITQAISYTPGVIAAFGGTDSRYDVAKARGGLFLRQYLDGLVLPFSAYSVAVPQFDPYMLERIEVLQGPASGLFGQTTPGGILNMVSRRPVADPQHEVLLQGGNFNRRELAFDSSGPIDADAKLLYRITGLDRSNDGNADFTHEKRTLIAPSLTWRASTDTSLTVLAHYQTDDVIPQYQGLPESGTLTPGINGKLPRNRFSGEPGFERMDRKQTAWGYAFEHRLDSTWLLRQNLRRTDVDIEARGTPGFALSADQRTLSRVATQGLGKGSIFNVDTQAQADFSTAQWRHTLLLGLDYVKQRDDYRFASAVAPSIDLYNPVYNAALPTLIPRLSTLQTMDQTGVYVQDQLRNGRWVATLGGRFDRASAETRDRVNDSAVPRSDSAFTGRAGLNYLFDNGVAPYVSYSTSFEPIAGTDFFSEPFKPSTGKQFEAGVKFQPADSQTLVTLSAYQVVQQNVLTPDAAPGHAAFSVQTSEVRTQGINFEAKTRVGRQTDLIGSYAYTDSKVTKANPNAAGISLLGRPLPRVPEHMASLWLNHGFDETFMPGLSVGGGVRYVGANFADSSVTIRLPQTTLWDAAIHYDLGKANSAMSGYKLAFTVSNLTNREYVNYCLNALQCFYGQGRSAQLTLRKQW